MIRKRQWRPRLFYYAHEVHAPAAYAFWAELDHVVGDWEALAAPVAGAFSPDRGRGVDPVVYVKILLIGFFEGITYDTDLALRIEDSRALRRFLGYDYGEPTPDHSSISRNRKKLGEATQLEALLAGVVVRCLEAGLVSGEEVAGDATLVPANASLDSLRSLATGQSVREYLRTVKEHNEEAGTQTKPQVSNAEFRSTSDPDARLAQKPGQPRDLCYQVTHVTDGQQQVILAVACEGADCGESQSLRAPLQQAKEALEQGGLSLGRVVADAGYDDGSLHAYIEQLGAEPITNGQRDGSDKPRGFKKADFSYQPEEDTYRCPAGSLLARCQTRSDGSRSYRSRASDCAACPHRAACLAGGRRRTIRRGPHEESRERTLARGATAEGRAALRRRRQIVEPPFGHLKCHGGLALINCRGTVKALVKVVLAAVGWNLLKLVKAHRRTPAPGLAPGQTCAREGALPTVAPAVASAWHRLGAALGLWPLRLACQAA